MIFKKAYAYKIYFILRNKMLTLRWTFTRFFSILCVKSTITICTNPLLNQNFAVLRILSDNVRKHSLNLHTKNDNKKLTKMNHQAFTWTKYGPRIFLIKINLHWKDNRPLIIISPFGIEKYKIERLRADENFFFEEGSTQEWL